MIKNGFIISEGWIVKEKIFNHLFAPLISKSSKETNISIKINIKKLTRETRLIFLSPWWEKNTNKKILITK